MNVRLSFFAIVLLTACHVDADQPRSNAEKLLLHSFNYLEKANIGTACKGYLESVYAYNGMGKTCLLKLTFWPHRCASWH